MDGHLRNSAGDVAIDLVLLFAIICSYILQILRLRNRASCSGLSPSYLLFNTVFSTAQLSIMVLDAAFIWPDPNYPVLGEIREGRLRGRKALGAILGLLQIFVQWTCSVTLVIGFMRCTTSGWPRRTIPILASIHIVLVLLPAVALTLPKPGPHSWALGIWVTPLMAVDAIMAPTFVVLQFFAQFAEVWRRNGDPGALSLLSLCLQVPAMAALASRWYLRVPFPKCWSVRDYFTWGTPVVNYATSAIGSAVLLASYYFALRGKRGDSVESERTPLLG